MIEVLSYPFVKWAFLISFILVGIHSYLGSHIVRRGVIFTDLALAQFAVLGTVVGTLLGLPEHSPQLYLCSLSFALFASYLFSVIKKNYLDIPIEAMIGIAYAFASAMSILFIVKFPESSEQIKEMMVGSILFVSHSEVLHVAILYSVIGIIHFIFQKQIFDRSSGKVIKNSTLWDFVFYSTLAVVVTSSVEIAGVLLVFSFLIVPSVVSLILGRRVRQQLIIGWVFGLTSCVIGIVLAVVLDFPVGPMIVVTLISLMIPIYIVKRLKKT
jgi:zinc/manganese transport system permease protein